MYWICVFCLFKVDRHCLLETYFYNLFLQQSFSHVRRNLCSCVTTVLSIDGGVYFTIFPIRFKSSGQYNISWNPSMTLEIQERMLKLYSCVVPCGRCNAISNILKEINEEMDIRQDSFPLCWFEKVEAK